MSESAGILRNRYSIINNSNRFVILLFICIFALQGCASTSKKTDQELDPVDPHEQINRASYDFTDKVDRTVFVPIVNAYIDYVPDAAQRSIGNFYDNLSYPNVMLNSFCLLYTSDAADERSSVDLGGRRTIKKKKNI